ncbi:putative non-specific serine/threonine protein kinase [Helianthus annuus]|nr:putative non-specific serine/threonine protein kinase [Helianthus annuus]
MVMLLQKLGCIEIGFYGCVRDYWGFRNFLALHLTANYSDLGVVRYACCLLSERPKKRPSSEKLLKHPFFKHAKTADYLERSILDGLSPLGDRFRMLKAKEVDLLVPNKELYGDKEQLSQQEYIKGISAWNFNLEDIKNQAALIKEYDEISNLEEPKTSNQQNGINDNYSDAKSQDTADEIVNLESSFASFPTPSLQALKGCFDICEDDVASVSPTEQPPVQLSMKASDQETDKDDDIKHLGRIKSLQKTSIPGPRKYMSGSLLPDNVSSPKKLMSNGERDLHQLKFQVERSSSGPIQHIQRSSLTNSLSGVIFP